MSLKCSAWIIPYAFTPGREYRILGGGDSFGIDDDRGDYQFFCLNPRRSVRNEHPVRDFGLLFPDAMEVRPAREMSRFESVWTVFQREGVVRPLVLTRRYGSDCVKGWVSGLGPLVKTEASVRSIVRIADFNLLRATHGGSLPEGVYVSHLRDEFLDRDDNPRPVTVESFDFLHVA